MRLVLPSLVRIDLADRYAVGLAPFVQPVQGGQLLGSVATTSLPQMSTGMPCSPAKSRMDAAPAVPSRALRLPGV